MGIPGYDPSDLDDHLEERLSGRDLSEWLTAEQIEQYERGESLVEVLSGEDIERVLDLPEPEGTD